jgi:hypothetical protein
MKLRQRICRFLLWLIGEPLPQQRKYTKFELAHMDTVSYWQCPAPPKPDRSKEGAAILAELDS